MKKYVIEVSDDCMKKMQDLKIEFKVKNISQVVEMLTKAQPEAVDMITKLDYENQELTKHLIQLAMKI